MINVAALKDHIMISCVLIIVLSDIYSARLVPFGLSGTMQVRNTC